MLFHHVVIRIEQSVPFQFTRVRPFRASLETGSHVRDDSVSRETTKCLDSSQIDADIMSRPARRQ